MDSVLVVAPHPDDETLGCGGTLLRRKASGARLAWVIVTGISTADGWQAERVEQRKSEIMRVQGLYGFDTVHELGFATTRLDTVPRSELIAALAEAFRAVAPSEVLVPHRSDVHSDHVVTFDAVAACTKWFRYPSIRRVAAYETISETDFALSASDVFRPNSFVDIGAHLERKLEIMKTYASELAPHPFPRSIEALRALAMLRGAQSGYAAAEAFEVLRERS